MKILIIGPSGSGKSTLASALEKIYHLPTLHLDKICFYPNWVEKEDNEKISLLDEFMKSNQDGWIIDGTYMGILFEERLNQADLIIYLNFNRFTCYFSALKRVIKYHNKNRDSAPEDCKEHFSLSFQWWILFESRKKDRMKKYRDVIKKYHDKVIVLKNRTQVYKYLEQVNKKG